jgi:hypothetical protein
MQGIYLDKRVNKYVARITVNGKRKYVGSFESAKQARIERDKALQTAEAHRSFQEGFDELPPSIQDVLKWIWKNATVVYRSLKSKSK